MPPHLVILDNLSAPPSRMYRCPSYGLGPLELGLNTFQTNISVFVRAEISDHAVFFVLHGIKTRWCYFGMQGLTGDAAYMARQFCSIQVSKNVCWMPAAYASYLISSLL
jgi:hypothetical protein